MSYPKTLFSQTHKCENCSRLAYSKLSNRSKSIPGDFVHITASSSGTLHITVFRYMHSLRGMLPSILSVRMHSLTRNMPSQTLQWLHFPDMLAMFSQKQKESGQLMIESSGLLSGWYNMFSLLPLQAALYYCHRPQTSPRSQKNTH